MEPVNNLLGVTARIVSERKRLELSQAAFAAAVGVSLSSQKRYEKGERAPDTGYLTSLVKMGVDVAYVLTGEKAADPNIDREALVHVIRCVQTFLRLDLRPIEQAFSQAVHEIVESYRTSWTDPQRSAEADWKFTEVLQQSPVLLPDGRELAYLLEKVEFVQAARNLSLDPEGKAWALLKLYREEKATGKKADLAAVEGVLRQRCPLTL